jgi:hypothetical protein
VDDDRVANGSPVAVLSFAYWQRRFAGDRSVVGRTIAVNRIPFTIVGVAPPGFTGEVVGRMTGPVDAADDAAGTQQPRLAHVTDAELAAVHRPPAA